MIFKHIVNIYWYLLMSAWAWGSWVTEVTWLNDKFPEGNEVTYEFDTACVGLAVFVDVGIGVVLEVDP